MTTPAPRSPAPAPAELLSPAWQMLEHSVAATGLTDLDGRVVYANAAMLALWGFGDASQLVGRHAADLLWADAHAARAARAQVLARGAWLGEMTARRVDGVVAPLWCAAHVVVGADGAPLGMMASFVDRSTEVAAREHLERQSRFVEAVVGGAGVLVAVLDAQGRFVRFNRECERVSGWRADDVIGRTPWDTVLPAEPAARIRAEAFDAAMAAAVPGVVTHDTNEWVTRDGGRRLIEWSNTLLVDGDTARHMVAVGVDVTQRQLVQRALEASEARLRRAQRVTRTGVWELDLVGGRLDWSDEVYRIFELDGERAVASYEAFLDVVHPDDRTLIDETYRRSLVTREPYVVEHRLRMPDGRVKWVEQRCETEFDAGGRAVRSLGTVQDVTERRDRANELRRFRLMVEQATQEVWLVDPQHRARYVNEAAAASLGYAPAELAGVPLAQLDAGGEAVVVAVADDVRQRAAAGLPARTYEVEQRHRDGRLVPKELHVAPVEIDGETFGCVFANDIGERRAARAALAASEAALRATLDAYPGWVACADDDLRYVFVNTHMARLVGRRRDDIIGRHVEELRGAAVADELRAINRRLLAGERVELERRYAAADGSEHRYWVHYRVADDPVVPGRHVFYAFGTDLDELRLTQLRLRTIVEGTHIGTWEWDPRTGTIEVNDELPMLAGYTLDELPADALTWLNAQVHPDDRRARKALLERVLRRELMVFEGEYRIRHRAGHWVWLLERGKVVSIGDSGEPLLAIGSTQDISALKRTERQLRELNERLEARVAERTRELEAAKAQAERASAAKTEFLSRMSHELRTPLNAILGFGQLLEFAPLAGEDAENVREIMRAGRHLLDLINEVLDLASVEAGRIDLAPEAVPLRPLVDECLALVAPLARPSQLSLRCGVCDDCHPAWADRGRLKQVLLNLLSNAIKYNRAGGRVDVDCDSVGDGRCELRVNDTGPGLEPAQVERVFDPFERLAASRGPVEGTGIGLPVSKRLVELMGGEIGVRSEPGRGSTFWLRLPEAPATSWRDVATPAAPASTVAAPPPASHTLFYVEDNATNLLLMQRIVERRTGWRLIGCDDARVAVQRVLAEHPDLILLDLQLPYIDGYDLLAQLRRAGVGTAAIAVSANAMAADIERARAAGFADYLTKPLELSRVVATLAALLPDATPAEARPR